jgi:biopolymer transport protein TolR
VALPGKRTKRRLMAEINVVPYIDVMLVLLVIFMVTAPLIAQGIRVELPKAASKPIDSEVKRITLTIDAAGQMFLDVGDDPHAPLDAQRVAATLATVLRSRPDAQVYVKADRSLRYGDVVRAMALLTDAGVPRVGLVTELPEGR